MVDTQHFCLRWNNYQSSITSAFENLRDDEDFVDVTLACDGRSLKAHRVVLSACSPYFRELLKVRFFRQLKTFFVTFFNLSFNHTEHTMQAPSNRAARCCIYRFACTCWIHLSWWGKCASTVIELISKDSWNITSFWINTTTSRRNT